MIFIANILNPVYSVILSKSYFSTFIFLMLFFFTFTACHDEKALKQAHMDQIIQEKIAAHRQKTIASCAKEALAEALIIADSVMIQLALSRVDTSNRIKRPVKPTRPEIDLPTDTTAIKPLFEDSVIPTENPPPIIPSDTIKNDESSIN
ncbi:MAG: hypothetical protein AAF960_05140 [Bacteroidota bacterium]